MIETVEQLDSFRKDTLTARFESRDSECVSGKQLTDDATRKGLTDLDN